MISFLSCDWGTSSFRLSLVNAENFSVIKSEYSNEGILSTYKNWSAKQNDNPQKRWSFYLDIINHHITAMELMEGIILDGVPLIISGMASSSIGMRPLPYQELPFHTDGSGMLSEYLVQTPKFKHEILLISGVRSSDDVMRGEETQLIGIYADDVNKEKQQLYILPGTHSKHIIVKNNQAISFKTYMTGEFFNLLSTKSILNASLEEDGDFLPGNAEESFKKAVLEGSSSNLLNVCFRVRTNALFDKLTKKENYHYLSGLLIGAELGEIANNDTIEIYLCCSNHLKLQYETALEVLGLKEKVHSFSADAVEKAALIGQYKIYEKHTKR